MRTLHIIFIVIEAIATIFLIAITILGWLDIFIGILLTIIIIVLPIVAYLLLHQRGRAKPMSEIKTMSEAEAQAIITRKLFNKNIRIRTIGDIMTSYKGVTEKGEKGENLSYPTKLYYMVFEDDDDNNVKIAILNGDISVKAELDKGKPKDLETFDKSIADIDFSVMTYENKEELDKKLEAMAKQRMPIRRRITVSKEGERVIEEQLTQEALVHEAKKEEGEL